MWLEKPFLADIDVIPTLYTLFSQVHSPCILANRFLDSQLPKVQLTFVIGLQLND